MADERITATGRRAWLDTLAFWLLALLSLMLPFEVITPLLKLGPIGLTNVEIVVGLLLLVVTASAVKRLKPLSLRRTKQRPEVIMPSSWLVLWFLFALAAGASALLAPEFRGNALQAAGRTVSGLLLAWAAALTVRNQRHLTVIIGCLAAGGFAAALLGLVEVAQGEALPWLDPFRVVPTVAGPFMRLTGSFSHANQMAMYIEATLPLLIALAWIAWRTQRRGMALLLALAAGIYLQASILTYSRSSFATILLSSALVAAVLWWRRPAGRQRLALPWSATAGAVLLFVGFNALSDPVVRLRLTSEGDNEWYRVAYDVPAALAMPANGVMPVTVTVTNEGVFTWSDSGENPIELGGRWYWDPGDYEIPVQSRWSWGQDVEPGEAIALTVALQAPPWPGTYRLEWDVVQEHVVWFSQKNGIVPATAVTVAPTLDQSGRPLVDEAEVQAAVSALEQAPAHVPPIPGRRELWRVAAQRLQAHPWLGIGLDNFRLTYGRYLNWTIWNDTIHTNNWFMETLVSVGLLGSLPFFAWIALLLKEFLGELRQPTVLAWSAALAVALLAYMIHGLLDYFMLFNANGLLFWLLVGLWRVSVSAEVRGPK